MIGFAPPDKDKLISREVEKTPAEKEVPTVAPGREVGEPNPSVVPAPKPEIFINSPAPEITPIPTENPIPSTVPEILPGTPTEISTMYM
jgi:hypothetical protein